MNALRADTSGQHTGIVSVLALGVLLVGPSAAPAGECGDPCTVTASVPDIHLVDTTSGNSSDDWEIRTEAGLLRMGRLAGNQQLFTMEIGAPANTLHVDSNARVGINTNTPAADLQINSTLPGIRLDDISAGEGHADLRVAGNTFGIVGNNGFNVLALDTRAGSTVFFINQSGQLGLATLNPQARLHVDGDARIDGDIAIASSRSLKTAFEPVSTAEVLAGVADLPVSVWRYRAEDETERHIGPFAEDFQRLFGLGDGHTISMVDAQGVALAAIQGLQQELADRSVAIGRLQSENAALTARLQEIEERLGMTR